MKTVIIGEEMLARLLAGQTLDCAVLRPSDPLGDVVANVLNRNGQNPTEAFQAAIHDRTDADQITKRIFEVDVESPLGSACDGFVDSDWPIPVDILNPPKPPTLDLTLFPKVVAEVAEDAAERIGCAADFIIWSLIVVIATLIGPKVGIRPRRLDIWIERLCLWILNVGGIGSGKSPAMVEGMRPLREQALTDEATYRAECQVDDPSTVKRIRRTVGDTTVEKLGEIMIGSPGLLNFRDELSGLLEGFNKYSRGASDRRFYLECYSGGPFEVDRIGRGSLRIEDVYLNMLGGIQPDLLRDLVLDGPRDGMAARLVIIRPEVPNRDPVDRAPNRTAREALRTVCKNLAKADWGTLLGRTDPEMQRDEQDSIKLPYVQIADGAATSRWSAWHTGIMRDLREGRWEGRRAERSTKYPALGCRLILAWQLIEWAAGQADTTFGLRQVSEDTVDCVLRLIDTYLAPMDDLVYFEHDRATGATGARRIASWLAEARPSAITMRDVKRKHWSGLTEQPDVEAAFEYLATVGWIREQERDRSTRGRPAARFDVNPNIQQPRPN